MIEHLKKQRPEDPSHVGLGEAWEVHYWMQTLNVKEEELRAAVAHAGSSLTAVRQWLRSQPIQRPK